jgi:hypothetical protein
VLKRKELPTSSNVSFTLGSSNTSSTTPPSQRRATSHNDANTGAPTKLSDSANSTNMLIKKENAALGALRNELKQPAKLAKMKFKQPGKG